MGGGSRRFCKDKPSTCKMQFFGLVSLSSPFFFQRRKKKSGFFVFILSKRTHGDLETVEKNVL